MSETINHELFGELSIERDEDGRIHLNGEVSVEERPPCRLHVTGASGSAVDDILKIASDSHQLFLKREQELRESAVNAIITPEYLAEAAENIGERITREEANDSYKSLMVINYFTDNDETSIYFEDEEGIFGVDINLLSDLKFTEIRTNADG